MLRSGTLSNQRASASEHRETNFLLAAHPHSSDVAAQADRCLPNASNVAWLTIPTIGHHSDFTEPEAFPHAFDNRHQGRDVGRVARPHLTANRATLHVHGHAYNHLLEIGSVILSVTALADRLSASAFKVERSGVEKDQLHFGK